MVLQRGGSVQLTLIFEDSMGNLFGIMLVLFYITADLYITHYFYKRTFATESSKAYPYALASIFSGVAAPYIYALLLSFMGIMSNILPLLYVGLLYGMGMVVGLRIIPALIKDLTADQLNTP